MSVMVENQVRDLSLCQFQFQTHHFPCLLGIFELTRSKRRVFLRQWFHVFKYHTGKVLFHSHGFVAALQPGAEVFSDAQWL